MSMEKEWKTKDIYTASYLLAIDEEILRIDKEGKVCLFVFNREAEKQALDYINGAATSAIKLFNSFRTLKDKVFQR